jgi:antitoxin (DNA-binding transcriptional repressor) of toxin-antitoxin stability system
MAGSTPLNVGVTPASPGEPKFVEIHDAQQQLAELVAQAATGTDIILLDGQTPRARLVPIPAPVGQRVPGLHAGSITISPDFDQPLPDDLW